MIVVLRIRLAVLIIEAKNRLVFVVMRKLIDKGTNNGKVTSIRDSPNNNPKAVFYK
mgnify:CR=1 FL=1